MDDEEAKLLHRLREGDAAAVEDLMARYATRVYRLARGVTRNEADAEEVVQDVFLAVARKHERFEGRSALSSWIYRITMNAALNKRRGLRAEVETPLDDVLPAFQPDGHRAGERSMVLADWSGSPERVLLSEEARAAVRAALDRLPSHYRAVVVMRDVEGLSNEETAESLGEPISMVKSRLHRARMALREQLTRHYVSGT
jgi:RNA polymerase sigma-70 factor (ECF subfamily)